MFNYIIYIVQEPRVVTLQVPPIKVFCDFGCSVESEPILVGIAGISKMVINRILEKLGFNNSDLKRFHVENT